MYIFILFIMELCQKWFVYVMCLPENKTDIVSGFFFIPYRYWYQFLNSIIGWFIISLLLQGVRLEMHPEECCNCTTALIVEYRFESF